MHMLLILLMLLIMFIIILSLSHADYTITWPCPVARTESHLSLFITPLLLGGVFMDGPLEYSILKDY